MGEKAKIKISLVGLLLFLAIIVIAILGYLLYTNNSNTVQMSSREKELNAKIANLEKQLTVKKSSEKITVKDEEEEEEETEQDEQVLEVEVQTHGTEISFESLEGVYEAEGKENICLCLFENGSFIYYNDENTACGYSGYYTFNNNNEIFLHIIMESGNDIGRHLVNTTNKFSIEEGTITDNILGYKLKKSDKNPAEISEWSDNLISTQLQNSLGEGALY